MTIDPYKWLARAPHVKLNITRLPDDLMGRWIPDASTIELDDRLTQTERRCTLVHELVHRLHKDLPTLPPELLEIQERQCEKRAAKLLIPLNQLLDALLWSHDEHEAEIADQLWVDIPTLRDRLRYLTDKERHYLISRLNSVREYT